MKTFRVIIDATLSAEDLADAMRKIGEYYLRMGNGDPDETILWDSGHAGIQPEELPEEGKACLPS